MNIIFFSNYKGFDDSDYTTIIRVPFWTELSKHMDGRGKILIVNHPVSLSGMLCFCLYKQDNRVSFRSVAHQANDRLYVCTPFSFISFRVVQNNFVFHSLLRFQMKQIIRKYIKQFQFDTTIPCVVVVSHPFHHVFKNLFEEQIFVYHCADDFVLFNNADKPDILVKNMESLLANKADMIFCTAERLRDRLVQSNTETYYLPNGVDFNLFNQTQEGKMQINNRVRAIPRPRIGFTGVLSSRCDMGLIHSILRKKRDWSFVFVGKSGVGFENEYRKLSAYSNFYDLGWQSYYSLPSFLKGMDVVLLPYNTSELLMSVNPNKMYQYMASGIPIVSTPLPEVKRFEDCIDVADGTEEFINAIQKNIDTSDTFRIQRQVDLARMESWEKKAKYFLGKIKECLI